MEEVRGRYFMVSERKDSREIMGDSDDDYDRKRRDKFRGERTDSYRGGPEGGRRPPPEDMRGRRDDWNNDR